MLVSNGLSVYMQGHYCASLLPHRTHRHPLHPHPLHTTYRGHCHRRLWRHKLTIGPTAWDQWNWHHRMHYS